MSTWRRDLIEVLAWNLGIGLAVPLIGLLFISQPTLPWFLRSLTMSMAFSNCIGTLAFFTMPHVGSAFATKRFPLNWLILLGALGLIGVAGTLLALVILTYAGLFTPSVFWQIFRIAIRTTLLIAFVVGIAVTLYEVQRYRLASATLALRTRELERERALKLAAEARLASLESRIHPHFLFNTINSISALIREDPGRAERMLERMAALLRFSLDSQHRPLAQVAVELKIARDYLEVERARFGDRLRYSISAEPEAERCLLPALAVQTLVENSVKYAVSPRRSGATIRVSARRCGEALEVEVWDDGPGFTREAAADGHGIETLESRLAALFGGQALLASPAASCWTAPLMNGWIWFACRRCTIEPSDQEKHPSCKSRKPCNTLLSSPSSKAPGPTSRAAPVSPISMPARVGGCRRSPPGNIRSTPTIQNGEVVIIRAASPLGIQSSA